VVATKVLSPGQAVLLAACMNLVGAMVGTAVAKTIASGLIDTGVVSMTPEILICALIGATAWNLITWWLGLPSSSSHALVGGLCGAALAAADDNWASIIWSVPAAHWWQGSGVLNKVILPMLVSPLAGFVIGFLVMGLLFALLSFLNGRGGVIARATRPRVVNAVFAKLQIASSAFMGMAHGMNDAQKTMGIIALALAGATTVGSLDQLPSWLHFLRVPTDAQGQFGIAMWIKVVCALTMAAGTMIGGWRIVRTLGHKMVKLHPINGVAADITASGVIVTASVLGLPVSTTHNVSSAIMGVGSAKRLNAIHWSIVSRMVWAWLLTLPIAGTLAYLLVNFMQMLGWR
jgi:PiT family inorganic phosphate transporter